MAVTLHNHQSSVFAGLGTYTFTVSLAGLYFASGKCIEVPASGVIITINQNGSPVVTSSAYSGAQEVVSAEAKMVCAISDVITIVVTSNTPSDYNLNAVKTTALINLVASGS